LVFYTDENRFHAPALEAIADLPEDDGWKPQHSTDLHYDGYEQYLGAEYNINRESVQFYGDYPGVEVEQVIHDFFTVMLQKEAGNTLNFKYIPDDGSVP